MIFQEDMMMPLDYTGWGPAQSGFNPALEQMRRNSMNRFHSQRAADAMQDQDPYIRNMMEAQARILISRGNDAAEVRRRTYETASGQMAKDLALMGRRAGIIGHGDPVNTSYNIMRGIAGGGFGVRALDSSGNFMGHETVRGGGPLTENLAIGYQQKLMQRLYGNGTWDPEKLYGMNSEQASQIFANIYSQRGVGANAIAVQQNASLATRLDARMSQATNPAIIARLKGLTGVDKERLVTAEEQFNAGDMDAFKKTMDAFNDPLLRNELESIVKVKTASFINDNTVRQVADVVKEVSRGLSNIQDIYSELTDPGQLQMQLQSITGIRITDKASARRANVLMDDMRGAARASGIDPRAFLDMLQASTAGLSQQIAASSGLGDGRSEAELAGVSGAIRSQIGMRAVESRNLALQAEDLGVAGGNRAMRGTTRSLESYTKDLERGYVEFNRQYDDVSFLAGAQNLLGGADKQAADALLREFESAAPEDRGAVLAKIRSFLGDKLGGGSLKTARDQYRSAAMDRLGRNENGAFDRISDMVIRKNQEDVGTADIESLFAGSGANAADARTTSQALMRNLGNVGMQDMLAAARDPNSSVESKRARVAAIMKQAGMSPEQQAAFMRTMFNDDMSTRMSAGDRMALEARVAEKAYSDTSTVYGAGKGAAARLAQDSAETLRGQMSTDGSLSLPGVLKSLLTLKSGQLDTDEGRTLLAQTMIDSGMDVSGIVGMDIKDKFATGLDLSKGMTKEALDRINKVHGKDMNLAATLGYSSDAEMFAATANDPAARDRMLRALRSNEDLHMSGGINSMNVISPEALAAMDTSKVSEKFRQAAAATAVLFPTMDKGAQSGMLKAFGESGIIDTFIQADTFKTAYKGEGDIVVDGATVEDAKYVNMPNAGRLAMVHENLKKLDEGSRTAFLTSGAGEQTLAAMEKSLAEQKAAKAAGWTHIQTFDEEGKGTFQSLNDQFLKAQEAAIKSLRESLDANKSSNGVGFMRVERMEVINKPEEK